MPYNRTLVSNMALAHCGISIEITDVDDENSTEAEKCRMFIDHARRVVLEMKPWDFATRRVALTDIGITGSNYDGEWAYRYNYPVSAIRLNKIVNPAARTPSRQSERIPYRVVDKNDSGDAGKAILTDQDGAILEYNADIDDYGLMSSTFAHAQSLFLATLIVAPLRVNPAIAQLVMQAWAQWQAEASSQDFEMSQNDPLPNSSFESVRS